MAPRRSATSTGSSPHQLWPAESLACWHETLLGFTYLALEEGWLNNKGLEQIAIKQRSGVNDGTAGTSADRGRAAYCEEALGGSSQNTVVVGVGGGPWSQGSPGAVAPKHVPEVSLLRPAPGAWHCWSFESCGLLHRLNCAASLEQ